MVRDWARCSGLLALTLGGVAAGAVPPVPVPAENPITEEKRVLGKMLFWEEQLSSDHSTSCGTCHIMEFGSADPRLFRVPGVDGVFDTPDDANGSAGVPRQTATGAYVWDPTFGAGPRGTTRSASPVINAAFAPEVFWDGRAGGSFVDPETGQTLIVSGGALESQAVNPPLDDVEMAHESRTWGDVRARLAGVRPMALASDLPGDVAQALENGSGYGDLFEAAFGDPEITAARVAMAIATYERTLISDQTPWDRFMAGDESAMTAVQVDGWQRFQARRCIECHTPPLFTDLSFRSTGLRPAAEDPGRMGVTGDPADAARFKTPSLRNAGLKRTFQHTGLFPSLESVVDFYVIPPRAPEHADPVLDVVNPTPSDVAPISAFIRGGLTDPRVAAAEFPFDRPTLRSELPRSVVVIGGGTPHRSTDVPPRMIARTPPVLGSEAFRLGVTGVDEGESVTLLVSRTPPVGGLLTAEQEGEPVTATRGDGVAPVATAYWAVPSDGRFDGETFYFQFQTGTGARSEIARAVLFCGSGVCAIECDADTNGDGVLDLGDIDAFVAGFLAGDLAADLNGDGLLDLGDIGVFVSAFVGGCEF